MSHATRVLGLAKLVGRRIARTAQGVLVVTGVSLIGMLGLHYVQGEAADVDGALASSEEVVEVVALDNELSDDFSDELSVEMQRVRDWVAKRYRVSSDSLEPAFVEAELSAREAELDPLLIVAMIAVESSFNPEAKSHAGALGLMQVIPRWHMDKIGDENPATALFDPRFNVQVGTLVLVEGLQRYGSLEAALQYYNGARHDPEMRYTKRVLAVKRQLYAAAKPNGA